MGLTLTLNKAYSERGVVVSGQHTGKFWLPEEDEYLTKFFPITDTKKLVSVFNCALRTIQNRAHKLGIRKDPKWKSESARAIAVANYAKLCNSGFKKGHKAWNAGNRIDAQEDDFSVRERIPTCHGYQVVKEVTGGRVVQHVMRG